MKYRARAAYDGTDFYGFQRQSGFRSVQGEIETALARILELETAPTVQGAGRTDTGVHATGQVIAFEADWAHPVAALQRALNVNLPGDVAIRELEACADQFSPRFDARSRTYAYTAYVSPVRSPLRDRFAWHIEREPDLAAMNAAARILTGTHDFAAFGSPTGDSDTTVRTVMRSEWRREAVLDGAGAGMALTFEIEANAFLYRMVRRIVNALVQAGLGRLSVDEVEEALASRDQNRITGLAPACGLCLVDVSYQV